MGFARGRTPQAAGNEQEPVPSAAFVAVGCEDLFRRWYKSWVSRIPTPAQDGDGVEHELVDQVEEVADDLEELGDEAIIAQQTEAHLPQKRANVHDDSRSIVISEDPAPSSRWPEPYRAERSEATVVVRDRRELEAMRLKAVSGTRRPGGAGPYVWAGLAIAAFAAGGLVTLLLVRSSAPDTLQESVGQAVQEPARHPRLGSAMPEKAAQDEPVTPQVQLEELPLEKPRRR